MSVFDIFAEVEQILDNAGELAYFRPQFQKWQKRHLQFCANKLSPEKRPEFLRRAREICSDCKIGKWFLLWNVKFCGIPLLSAYQPSAMRVDYRLFGLPAASKQIAGNRIRFNLFGLPLIKITRPE